MYTSRSSSCRLEYIECSGTTGRSGWLASAEFERVNDRDVIRDACKHTNLICNMPSNIYSYQVDFGAPVIKSLGW